jgi:hypothetical protein
MKKKIQIIKFTFTISLFLLALHSQAQNNTDNIETIEENETMTGEYQFIFDAGILGQNKNAQQDLYYTPQEPNNYSYSFILSNGVKLESGTYIGFATGVEYFNVPVMPLMIDFNQEIPNKNLTPYFYFRMGGVVPLDSELENNSYSTKWSGGFVGCFGIGVKKYFQSNVGLSFSLGYRYQEIVKTVDYPEQPWNPASTKVEYFLNRAVVRIGISFQ